MLFEQILHETQRQIRCYILRSGVPMSSVDDVAQEVYLQFHKAMERRPIDVEPIRWLKGIARNRCLVFFRKKASRRRTLEGAITEKLATHDPVSEWERLQAQSDWAPALQECMAGLSDKNRQIIELTHREEQTCFQIAEKMRMSASNVRSVLCRCRLALRKCMMAHAGVNA